MKRREFPQLATVFSSDSLSGAVPAIAVLPLNKRTHNRFNKAQVVLVQSELYGDCFGVLRNISLGGALIEMEYAPPLGCIVTVEFAAPPAHPDDALTATATLGVRAEVKHHHCLNVGVGHAAARVRAVGMRFVEYVTDELGAVH